MKIDVVCAVGSLELIFSLKTASHVNKSNNLIGQNRNTRILKTILSRFTNETRERFNIQNINQIVDVLVPGCTINVSSWPALDLRVPGCIINVSVLPALHVPVSDCTINVSGWPVLDVLVPICTFYIIVPVHPAPT